jgi:tetratricopeptide (TPR) repeat protein
MNQVASTYNISSIRELLLGAFTTETLRRFCLDHPQFRPVTNDFSPALGLNQMVDRLIEYCQTQSLFGELLVVVKKENPRQYALQNLKAPYSYQPRVPQPVGNLRPWDRLHIFQDRTEETKALLEHLGKQTSRLICILGAGGMGKTALACYVLAPLEPRAGTHKKISDDIHVDILYLTKKTGLSLERIYDEVMTRLDGPTASWLYEQWTYPGASLEAKAAYLLTAMQDDNILYIILLDNLEDCLTEERTIAEEGLRHFVEDCLTQKTNVQLIATSRQKISLPAGTSSCIHNIYLDGLLEEDAVSFLRALDPWGQLGLKDALEDNLRDSSRYVRGIPLALELVAGLLDDDPTLCLGSLMADKALLDKQIVQQLLDHVYPRLSPGEIGVVQALAIYDRPVDKSAISFLLHPWFPKLDIQSALRRLAHNFIVTVHRGTGEYSLHLLHWEYVDSRLPADEKSDDYNRRNLQLRAAEYYKSKRKPEREWDSIEDLASQLAEFNHRIHGQDHTGACQVLNTIERYLDKWGYYSRLVELRSQLLNNLQDPLHEAENLGSLGEAYGALGQDEKAIEFYKRALRLTRETTDEAIEQRLLRSLGSAHRNLGSDEVAIDYYEQALSIAPAGENQEEKARLLNALGYTYWHQEFIDKAIECYQEALDITQVIKNDEVRSLTLGNFGFAYHKRGQLDRALEAHERALSAAQGIGHLSLETRHLSNIGYVCHDLGDFERAVEYQKQALKITREIGNLREESNQIDRLGNTYHSMGQFAEAITQYEKSLTMVRGLQNHRGESYRLLGLSRALLGQGDLVKAQQHCEDALPLEMPGWTTYQLPLTLGTILLYENRSGAETRFVEAAQCARDMLQRTPELYKAQYALAPALVGRAICDPAWQDKKERRRLLAPARAAYLRALEICSAPGIVHDARWNLEMIQDAGIKGLVPIFELLADVELPPPSGR